MHTIADLLGGKIGLQIHDTPEDREQLQDFLAYMKGQGFTWGSGLPLVDGIDMDKLIDLFAHRASTYLLANVSERVLHSNTPRRGADPFYTVIRISELQYKDKPQVNEELSISLNDE